MRKKVLSLAAATVVITGGAGSVVSAVPPAQDNEKKVTICHSTTSVTNPYNAQSVGVDSADGDTGNDNGQGDHSQENGPVAMSETVAQTLKDAKTKWGDIIPPHNNYPGLNWTAEGQAIYNNDCDYATPGVGGGDPPSSPPASSSVTTASNTSTYSPQVVAPAPGQGVNAGGGGALLSLLAVLGSTGALGYGVFRFRKLNI